MHTVFALLCFVVVIHWLIFPYPSGLLHWHCGNLTTAPVPTKQPWWIWINTSCENIMNDCITTTKQSTTKTCAYFLGYTVWGLVCQKQISRAGASHYIPQILKSHKTYFVHDFHYNKWILLYFPQSMAVWLPYTLQKFHYDVMKWKHFPCDWPFLRATIGHWWIPFTKGQ